MPRQGIIEGKSVEGEIQIALDGIVRRGAQRMLQEALEVEVSEFIGRLDHVRDEEGHRLVVRHGHLPSRRSRMP